MNLEKLERKTLSHKGKANDVFTTSMPGILEIFSTDRVTADNGTRTAVIPGKGKANNVITSALYRSLEESGIKTHYLGPGSSECSRYVVRAVPIPLEVIFRFRTAGSFARAFQLPEGIEFNGVFVEFTYKSDTDGDPRISDWSIVKDGILTTDELTQIRSTTSEIAYATRKFFQKCNATLIDGKVEFGYLPNGEIILIDEISADSVRVVDCNTGESLDKDRFRQNMADVAMGYYELADRISRPNL